MEKIIKIDGVDYTMKSTAANMLKYKMQFNRDLLVDLQMIQELKQPNGEYDFSRVDLMVLYDMVWLLLKAANPELPPPIKWLDTLETFPLLEAATEAMKLYTQSMAGTAKNAQPMLK